MKKLFSLLALFSLVLVSCEGDPGPPGPQGPSGLDGLIGSVFEYQVTFDNLNDDIPVATYDFPSNLEIFDTDVVLAYVLIDVIEGVDVWEPLPRTLYFNDGGILSYGFNYTAFDIQFFMDGNVDYNSLAIEYTDDLIMRVAVVPADLIAEIDVNDMSQVMSVANIINNQDIVIE